MLVFLLTFFLSLAPFAADGDVSEWTDVPPAFTAEPARPDQPLQRVWLAADRDRIHVRVALADEVILQRKSGLVLRVDADGLAHTGRPFDGLGIDLEWDFGERTGRAFALGLPIEINPAAIGLRQAPTVSARTFEIALDRRASVAGAPLFPGDTAAVVIEMRTGEHANATGPLRLPLPLRDDPPPPLPPISLERARPTHLRVLTWNVLFDGLFDRPEPFGRVLAALRPDILSLQEIYLHDANETRARIETFLPGERWEVAGDRQGLIVSRHPIVASGSMGSPGRATWARIAAPFGEMLVINPHPPCCDDDAGREREFDAIAAWLRDARGAGTLNAATPVLVAGDMNLVGDARQVRTLLEGAIVDTAAFGPPAPPDGDATPFADPMPRHLTGLETYTWRSDDGPFAPGRLDWIVYTDSVLGVGRSFVLWTPDLPDSVLAAAGLRRDDTAVASDHLPVVVDVYRLGDSSR